MKKYISIILAVCTVLLLFTACSGKGSNSTSDVTESQSQSAENTEESKNDSSAPYIEIGTVNPDVAAYVQEKEIYTTCDKNLISEQLKTKISEYDLLSFKYIPPSDYPTNDIYVSDIVGDYLNYLSNSKQKLNLQVSDDILLIYRSLMDENYNVIGHAVTCYDGLDGKIQMGFYDEKGNLFFIIGHSEGFGQFYASYDENQQLTGIAKLNFDSSSNYYYVIYNSDCQMVAGLCSADGNTSHYFLNDFYSSDAESFEYYMAAFDGEGIDRVEDLVSDAGLLD